MTKFDVAGPRSGVYTGGPLGQLRARWQINKEGWNSPVEYRPGPAGAVPRIAVFGDSYVEAFQVDVHRSFPSLLRNAMAGRYDVMSFGISGAPLSQYLQMSRYAVRTFGPDVLIVSVVHNDFDESVQNIFDIPGNRHMQFRLVNGAFAELPGAPYERRAWKRKLRRAAFSSACFRYFYLNLHMIDILFQPVPLRRYGDFNANVDVAAVDRNRSIIEAVTVEIVRRFREENRGRRVLFVMDAPRWDVYNGRASESSVRWMNELMARAAREMDADFLDLTSEFERNWATNHEHFEWSFDGHWNERGHEVVAHAIYRKLVEMGLGDTDTSFRTVGSAAN